MAGRARIAVAGAGAFGLEHLRRLAAMQGVEIAGVAEKHPDAARDALARLGITQVAADVRALIADKPDGIVIATPGRTHVRLAAETLAAGIPVLVEKPVGMNAAEARSLAEAERRSGAFVLPGHVTRFSRHHRMLHEIARSEIGAMLSFTSRRHRDDGHAVRYAEVDPVLMTMIHDIDMGLWMTGAGIRTLHAMRRPPNTVRADTMMQAAGKNGVSWQLHAAWTFAGAATPPDRVEIVGEDGSVELEAGTAIRQYGAQSRTIDLAGLPEDPLAEELAYFVQCIRSGNRPEIVTMADACEGLSIADAVIAAAKDPHDPR
ncbi:MAG TPA: Gfo/Idh/MocA family oxidoreductase [Dongiaceae bacterium]|nr:Gfo/Idh/MocA family oxidoreductase [Dongiaceae bacterium]